MSLMRRKKVTEMSKNDRDNDPKTERDNGSPDIVWNLTNDGLRPSEAPWGFIARNPVQVSIPPGGSRTVNLQVSANRPMLAFPVARHASTVKVFGQPGLAMVTPATEVTVVIQNTSEHSPLTIDDKEGLVGLHPLNWRGTSAVG